MPSDKRAAESTPEDLLSANERLVIRSVHDQEAAELAERQRAELSALVEALGEGVIIAEGTGRLLMMNTGAQTLFGLEAQAETVDALDALDLRSVDDEPLPVEKRPLQRAMRGELFVDAEIQIARPGASARRMMASGTSVVVAGHINLAIVVFHDVTARTRLEARAAHAERLASLGTLTAGVAHGVNNPLTYILGNLEFAQDALREAQEVLRGAEVAELVVLRQKLREVEGALEDAREGGARVDGIVRALGHLARVEDTERCVMDPTEGLESALSFTESRLRLSARVRRDFRATPMVLANRGQLAQIVTNLVINAAQAIGEGSADANEIVLATFTDEAGRAVIEVRDTGPGMPPDVLFRVFDPFFTTRSIGQGMGLGLSISHSIARALGGELSAESKVAVGTTFRLVLPPALAPLPRRAVDPPVQAPGRRGLILVIDDEAAVGTALARLLRREHDVTVVTDGGAGLARLAAGAVFDVIFGDLMMPVMTGMEFYERLRIQNPSVAKRVVILTGGAFSEAASAFLESFTQPTLDKPVRLAELQALLTKYVAMPHSP